jgi:aspartate/methionine/tyrosine aminotransferase
LHFISDEVYALSIFTNPDFPDATPFTSALSMNLTDIIHPSLVHVTYALSKDFGAAGLKVGCLITRNEELKKAVTAVARFCAVSGLSAAAAIAMLEDREWCWGFISLSRVRLAEAYTYITSRLKEIGVQYMEGGNAGFFVWTDMSPYLQPESELCRGAEREQVLAQRFEDNGVCLQPGEEHGRLGWFRLVFTTKRHVLEEGLRRIEKTVREIRGY